MNFLNITYDLMSPGQDYKGAHDVLQSTTDWCRPTKSQYLVQTTRTCQELLALLKPHLDKNDRILMTPFDPEDWYYQGSTAVLEVLRRMCAAKAKQNATA